MKQKGICEECKKEYEYEYNPKYPRKYCPECSAAKKKAYEDMQETETFPVVKPGEPVKAKGDYEPVSMYVSYAKDLFCAVINSENVNNSDCLKVMKECTDLVKQAKEAFS